jgi:hypothetical protein
MKNSTIAVLTLAAAGARAAKLDKSDYDYKSMMVRNINLIGYNSWNYIDVRFDAPSTKYSPVESNTITFKSVDGKGPKVDKQFECKSTSCNY